MATLPSGSVDELWRDLMSEFSGVRTAVPINKNQFRALLVLIDADLETAESSIVGALPAGPGKSWLVANPTLGRLFIERTERKRKEDI